MSGTPGSELQFVTNLRDLLMLQDEKYSKDYIKDLKEVDRLGLTLPKLDFPKDFVFKATQSDSDVDTEANDITVTLKSIKPPYKFQKALKASAQNTVYKLKEDLIASDSEFKSFEPKNFKFLIKGKVLNDSSFIRDVSSTDVAITVFVTAPTVAAEASVRTVATDENQDAEPQIDVPGTDENVGITEEVWTGFQNVLLQHNYSQEDAATVLQKLRRSWDV